MAKKQSKAQKRKATTARGKARKVAKVATKRTVVKAKAKRASMKKAMRKVKRPVAPVVDIAARSKSWSLDNTKHVLLLNTE